jgi:hypothetical protein
MLKTLNRVSIILNLTNMKKHFLGLSVIAFAFVLAAFTPPKSKPTADDLYVFEFDGSVNGYAKEYVENESNTYWKYVGMGEELCDDTPDRACRVAVTAAYVDNPSSPTALSGVTIDADESALDIAYVIDITASSVNLFSNKD